jgi:hypothetical protein
VDGESTVTGRGAAIGIKNRHVEVERNVADDESPQAADALSATLRRNGVTVERSSTHARTVAVTRCSLGSTAPSW